MIMYMYMYIYVCIHIYIYICIYFVWDAVKGGTPVHGPSRSVATGEDLGSLPFPQRLQSLGTSSRGCPGARPGQADKPHLCPGTTDSAEMQPAQKGQSMRAMGTRKMTQARAWQHYPGKGRPKSTTGQAGQALDGPPALRQLVPMLSP